MDLEQEVKDILFKQKPPLDVHEFQNGDPIEAKRVSLLAISNLYGLTVVGGEKEFRVFMTGKLLAPTKGYDGVPVALPSAGLCHLGFSCDELTLSACCFNGDTLSMYFYDVRAISKTKPNILFCQVEVPSELVDLKWHPAEATKFAAVFGDGGIGLYEIYVRDGGRRSLQQIRSVPPDSGISCLCWSPKGKQFVVGKRNSTVEQYDMTCQLKKQHGRPSSDVSSPVRDILWYSTYEFFAVFDQVENNEIRPRVYGLLGKKGGDMSWINFDDIYFGMGSAHTHYTFVAISEWDMILSVSSRSLEVVAIGKSANGKWQHWTFEDTGRAELPLAGDDEQYPTGLVVDRTSTEGLQMDEKSLPPAPIVMMYSSLGKLCPYSLINKRPGMPSINQSSQKRPPMPANLQQAQAAPTTPTAAPSSAQNQSPATILSSTGVSKPLGQPPAWTAAAAVPANVPAPPFSILGQTPSSTLAGGMFSSAAKPVSQPPPSQSPAIKMKFGGVPSAGSSALQPAASVQRPTAPPAETEVRSPDTLQQAKPLDQPPPWTAAAAAPANAPAPPFSILGQTPSSTLAGGMFSSAAKPVSQPPPSQSPAIKMKFGGAPSAGSSALQPAASVQRPTAPPGEAEAQSQARPLDQPPPWTAAAAAAAAPANAPPPSFSLLGQTPSSTLAGGMLSSAAKPVSQPPPSQSPAIKMKSGGAPSAGSSALQPAASVQRPTAPPGEAEPQSSDNLQQAKPLDQPPAWTAAAPANAPAPSFSLLGQTPSSTLAGGMFSNAAKPVSQPPPSQSPAIKMKFGEAPSAVSPALQPAVSSGTGLSALSSAQTARTPLSAAAAAAAATTSSAAASTAAASVQRPTAPPREAEPRSPLKSSVTDMLALLEKQIASTISKPTVLIGNQKDLEILRARINELTDTVSTVDTDRSQLSQQVSSLREGILESHARLQEAEVLHCRFRDPQQVKLLRNRPLDSSLEEKNAERLKTSREIKRSIIELNNILDSGWQRQHEAPKMRQPALGDVYKALKVHRHTIVKLSQDLDSIRSKTTGMKLSTVPMYTSTPAPKTLQSIGTQHGHAAHLTGASRSNQSSGTSRSSFALNESRVKQVYALLSQRAANQAPSFHQEKVYTPKPRTDLAAAGRSNVGVLATSSGKPASSGSAGPGVAGLRSKALFSAVAPNSTTPSTKPAPTGLFSTVTTNTTTASTKPAPTGLFSTVTTNTTTASTKPAPTGLFSGVTANTTVTTSTVPSQSGLFSALTTRTATAAATTTASAKPAQGGLFSTSTTVSSTPGGDATGVKSLATPATKQQQSRQTSPPNAVLNAGATGPSAASVSSLMSASPVSPAAATAASTVASIVASAPALGSAQIPASGLFSSRNNVGVPAPSSGKPPSSGSASPAGGLVGSSSMLSALGASLSSSSLSSQAGSGVSSAATSATPTLSSKPGGLFSAPTATAAASATAAATTTASAKPAQGGLFSALTATTAAASTTASAKPAQGGLFSALTTTTATTTASAKPAQGGLFSALATTTATVAATTTASAKPAQAGLFSSSTTVSSTPGGDATGVKSLATPAAKEQQSRQTSPLSTALNAGATEPSAASVSSPTSASPVSPSAATAASTVASVPALGSAQTPASGLFSSNATTGSTLPSSGILFNAGKPAGPGSASPAGGLFANASAAGSSSMLSAPGASLSSSSLFSQAGSGVSSAATSTTPTLSSKPGGLFSAPTASAASATPQSGGFSFSAAANTPQSGLSAAPATATLSTNPPSGLFAALSTVTTTAATTLTASSKPSQGGLFSALTTTTATAAATTTASAKPAQGGLFSTSTSGGNATGVKSLATPATKQQQSSQTSPPNTALNAGATGPSAASVSSLMSASPVSPAAATAASTVASTPAFGSAQIPAGGLFSSSVTGSTLPSSGKLFNASLFSSSASQAGIGGQAKPPGGLFSTPTATASGGVGAAAATAFALPTAAASASPVFGGSSAPFGGAASFGSSTPAFSKGLSLAGGAGSTGAFGGGAVFGGQGAQTLQASPPQPGWTFGGGSSAPAPGGFGAVAASGGGSGFAAAAAASGGSGGFGGLANAGQQQQQTPGGMSMNMNAIGGFGGHRG